MPIFVRINNAEDVSSDIVKEARQLAVSRNISFPKQVSIKGFGDNVAFSHSTLAVKQLLLEVLDNYTHTKINSLLDNS